MTVLKLPGESECVPGGSGWRCLRGARGVGGVSVVSAVSVVNAVGAVSAVGVQGVEGVSRFVVGSASTSMWSVDFAGVDACGMIERNMLVAMWRTGLAFI